MKYRDYCHHCARMRIVDSHVMCEECAKELELEWDDPCPCWRCGQPTAGVPSFTLQGEFHDAIGQVERSTLLLNYCRKCALAVLNSLPRLYQDF